jgi:hypothetical protein
VPTDEPPTATPGPAQTRNQHRVPDHDTPEPLKPKRATKRSHQTPCCSCGECPSNCVGVVGVVSLVVGLRRCFYGLSSDAICGDWVEAGVGL